MRPDRIGNLDGPLIFRPVDLNPDGRLLIIGHPGVGIFETVANGGNIAKEQRGAIGSGADRDGSKFLPELPPLPESELYLATIGLDGSAGEIKGGPADPCTDILQGQAVSPEGILADINAYFQRPGTGDLCL